MWARVPVEEILPALAGTSTGFLVVRAWPLFASGADGGHALGELFEHLVRRRGDDLDVARLEQLGPDVVEEADRVGLAVPRAALPANRREQAPHVLVPQAVPHEKDRVAVEQVRKAVE